MKKLQSWEGLKSGEIYNRVYIGNNDAYGRINGKETFLVLQTEAPLQATVLFDQFGDPHTNDIRSNVITFTHPDFAFKEFELFKPESEEEWFKKSVKVTSLNDALKFNITMEDIKRTAEWRHRSPFMPTFDAEWKMKGVQCSFRVEDRTANPLLQTVFIVWPNWETMKADFKGLGLVART